MKLSRTLALIDRFDRGRLSPIKGGASTTGIASPWSDGQLEQFVWSDILGVENAPVTRKEAMSVPAVASGRHRIVAVADRPLRALDNAEDITTEHPWLYRTDVDETAWQRMAHTLDDQIFYGVALWLVAREAPAEGQAHGIITDARRVPFHRWQQDEDGTVFIDGTPVAAESCLVLEGPFDGLLNIAADTIRGAKAIERAWAARVRNPSPTIIAEEKEEGGFTKKEAQKYVEQIAAATRTPDGTVIFAPYKVNLRLEENSGVDVLTEARNSVRIDIANFLNLNASALDGSKPQSSLTYETQETERQELADRMSFWTAPLEHRLSQDDVVPAGVRVRFDFASSTPAQTGTPMED
ncbi:hypothetical protein [uncultured Microbacterium sp.]|uniref:hypothetical protein n=1 Tax=uncultured Microbacterium sp. TaxID=191216 RepID=UPI0026250F13|nr:hypothetical protein [uncultured Microbacterium sp.]